MRKIWLSLNILCLFVVLGCGQWVPVRIFDTIPKKQLYDIIPETRTDIISGNLYDKNYKTGETRTAFIGQEIIRVRPYTIITTTTTERKAIPYSVEKIASSREHLYIEARDRLTNYKIRSEALGNHSITKSININGQKYDMIFLSGNYGTQWGILIDDKGEVFKSGLYSNDYEMMFYPKTLSITPAKFNISLRKIPEPESKAKPNVEPKVERKTNYYTPFELIYSGKNNVSLNVIYREYTPDNIARIAFFQNITYQADAKNIRYKDFVIKIISATNEKITYTVLSDGLE